MMEGVQQWMRHARRQNENIRIPHQYRINLRTNMDELKTMIAYGFCGLPGNSANSTGSYNANGDFISLYSNEKQAIINSAVKAVLYDYNDTHIYLAITYLLCKQEDNNNRSDNIEAGDTNVSNLVPVCIFGFSSSGKKYKFIDSRSRIYSSWNFFLDNNRLPPCKYCFPAGGIYTSTNDVMMTQSPSSTTLSRAKDVCQLARAGASLISLCTSAAIGSSMIAGALALTGGYTAVRSTNALFDCKLFDERSTKDFKIFNGTGLAVSGLGIYSSVNNISRKSIIGELELIDVRLLCLQLLVVSGTLLNARQLFKCLSNTNGTNANISKTLTKTQKRNLRIRFAEARARGADIVNVVTMADLSSNSENSTVMLNSFMPAGLKILQILYPRAEIIFHNIKSILDDYDLMKERKLSQISFMCHVIRHFQNLMIILKEDLIVLSRELFSFLNFSLTEQEKNNAATSLDNGLTEISSTISGELEDGTDESAQETTNIQNMVPVSDDTVIRSLCKFLSRFSGEIYDLCLIHSNDDVQLANNEELVQVYRMTMISAINRIMPWLPPVMNDERFGNNEQLFGMPAALAIKSYEERKIFEDAVSSLSVQDLFLSSARQVISRRTRDYYSGNVEYLKIHDITYYLNSTLGMIRKEDNSPFLYQDMLELLKRLLLDKLSNSILSVDNIMDRCERDLTSKLDVLRLENDHFLSYCIRQSSAEQNSNNDEDNSVQSITKDEIMEYRKIFEISCLCLHKLQNAGFSAPGVSIGKLITILIDFVKTKLVNEFRNNRATYVSQRDSLEIFIKLIDALTNQIITDDLFLAECIEFCLNRLERVDHVLIWKGVLHEEGVELLTFSDVNDFQTLRDRLQIELNIDLGQFNRVWNHDNYCDNNFYAFTVNESYGASNIDMVIAYRESESSSEYFVMSYKKNPESIEFCCNHLERVDHAPIREGVSNDEDVKSLTLRDVNNFETLCDRLEIELNIDLWQFNRVPNNDDDNFYSFTVKNSYIGSNIDTITAYRESESSNIYFIIIYEKREVQ